MSGLLPPVKGFSMSFSYTIRQRLLVVILCCQAGVSEVAIHLAPFPQPTVIEEFELLGDDERDDSVCEAFLEHHQTAHTTVPVLEGVDGLISDADSICFEDVPGLLVGESTALDMVGVVGEVNLCTVVDASADFSFLFLPESL